jgi:predicted amidophosphoribosyltransferase
MKRPTRRLCPSCSDSLPPGKYLCRTCWGYLPSPAQRALRKRDRLAIQRYQELTRQLEAGASLDTIAISP